MIDIYLDGADLNAMREARKNPLVKGFTCNPTLMRQSGITDYEAFAMFAIEIANGLPISFEVFSDEWDEMERQARKIASWGENVNVKIPVTNTRGESAEDLVKRLCDDDITCNVTAVFNRVQMLKMSRVMKGGIISVFSGRIADTGVDPMFVLRDVIEMIPANISILWASPREVLNIYQAEQAGCDIITVPLDMLKKYEQLKGKNLAEYSLETVSMFYNDAKKAGYVL